MFHKDRNENHTAESASNNIAGACRRHRDWLRPRMLWTSPIRGVAFRERWEGALRKKSVFICFEQKILTA